MMKTTIMLINIIIGLLCVTGCTPPITDFLTAQRHETMAMIYHRINNALNITQPKPLIHYPNHPIPLMIAGHWMRVDEQDQLYVPHYTTMFSRY